MHSFLKHRVGFFIMTTLLIISWPLRCKAIFKSKLYMPNYLLMTPSSIAHYRRTDNFTSTFLKCKKLTHV